MRTKLVLLSVLVLMGLTGCGSAHKTVRPEPGQLSQIKTLAVVVKQENEFEVVYHRATANGTSAVLFGIAGAAITASIDEGKDKEKAAAMAETVSGISCQTTFTEALSVLKQNTRFEKVDLVADSAEAASLKEYDAVVTFTIKQWGLRLVDQKSDLVAGFVELDMKMKTGSDNKMVWDERHVAIGQGREYLRKYISNGELLQNEVTHTLQEAGVNVSNLLLYQ